MHQYTSNSPSDLPQIGRQLLLQLLPDSLILLTGTLGAGKTTLTKALAGQLNISPATVKSPTFSLLNQYQTPDQQSLNHLDLYRLSQADPLLINQINELLRAPNHLYTIVEWGDRLNTRQLHFQRAYNINLQKTSKGRQITLRSID